MVAMQNRLLLVLGLTLVAAGVAGYYYFAELHLLARAGMVIAGVLGGALVALQSETGRATWEFAKGSRLEVRKVVWPTRKETVQTTGIVIALVIVAGLYIWLVDWVLSSIVQEVFRRG